MLSMQSVVNNLRIILSKQEYHVIILVTVVYTRSSQFSMFLTWTQAMTCVTLLMIIDYQFKIRIRILLTAIKLFLLLILTRKLSVQHLTNSHICWIHKSLISEIWLKDNPHLLDYVKIDSYEVKFRNTEHTRGGGVGSYVRSDIRYKLRNIVNINTDTEHLWLEVTLRNKN